MSAAALRPFEHVAVFGRADVIDPDAPVWARVVDWLATRLD